MLAAQLINIAPPAQQNGSHELGRSHQRGQKSGADSFETALKQSNAAAKPGPEKSESAPAQNQEPDSLDQAAPGEEELYDPAISIAPPPIIEQPDITGEMGEKLWAPHLSLLPETAAIVSILEGYPNNMPTDTEIVPLLQDYLQKLNQLDLPASPQLEEFQVLLEEVLARMPQTQEISLSTQDADDLNKAITALRGYLSPLENVNDTKSNRPQTQQDTATIIPLRVQHSSYTPPTHTENNFTGGEQQQQHNENLSEIQNTATTNTIPMDIAPQRAAFADTLAAATSQTLQFSPQNVFEALIERVVMLPDAAPNMEIDLKPDHLGKLSINLVMGENGLTAKISASDEAVRNQLAAQINRLSESLAEKGIQIESVEVSYSALADKPFDQRQQESGRQNGKQQAPIAGISGSQSENSPGWWESGYESAPYDDGLGLSSVEYRA